MEKKRNRYYLAGSLLLLLLILILGYFLFSIFSTRTQQEKESVTSSDSKKEIELGAYKAPAPPDNTENQKKPEEQQKSPSEQSEDNFQQKIIRATRKARETSCPLLVYFHNNTDVSRTTSQNLFSPKVQEAIGDMVVLKKEIDQTTRNGEILKKIHLPANNSVGMREYKLPVLLVFEPWATNTMTRKAKADQIRDRERTLLSTYENNRKNKKITLYKDNISLSELARTLTENFRVRIEVHRTIDDDIDLDKFKISFYGNDITLRDALHKIRNKKKLDFIAEDDGFVITQEKNKPDDMTETPLRLTKDNFYWDPIAALEADYKRREEDRQLIQTLRETKWTMRFNNDSLTTVMESFQSKTGEPFVISKQLQEKADDLSITISLSDTTLLNSLKLIFKMKSLSASIRNGKLIVHGRDEVFYQPSPLSREDIISFVKQYGCPDTGTMDYEKTYKIEQAIQNVIHGARNKREKAEKYLEELEPKYRSFIRKALRNSENREQKFKFSMILSTP